MIKNILYDWSGTLSNDLMPVYEADMGVFQRKGIQRISLEEFRREFELPYMKWYAKYIANPDKEELDKMFLEEFAKQDPPQIYEGVAQALLDLASFNMVVLSSHHQSNVEKEAKRYGIADYFKELNGSVHDKTKVIGEIMKRNGFVASETMYVGDMIHDIVAGKQAGVRTVAITWGYQDRERLETAKPDDIIGNISELSDLVRAA